MPRASALRLMWLIRDSGGNAPQVGHYSGPYDDAHGTKGREESKRETNKRRETMNGSS